MLERFTKERQRESKGTLFNLEDEDELTHYGQSLSKLDDFDNIGLGLEDQGDEDDGQIDSRTVRKVHFGGFESEDGDGDETVSGMVFLTYPSFNSLFRQSDRKKTKAEIMAEVISKSKEHKVDNPLDVTSVSLKRFFSSTSARCNKKRTRTFDVNLIKTWSPCVHCSTPSAQKGPSMKQSLML